MEKRDPTQMALQIAGLRANETRLPRGERLFEDPYAEFFFPEEVRKMMQDVQWVRNIRAGYEAQMPGVGGAIVARIKFIDDCLVEAVQDDFKQLVIVGAGYDTRAHRIQGVSEHLKVFEVDHPLTQAVKVDTIKARLGELPAHVAYVPVRFGLERLDHKLLASGYQADAKTLFIIEGLLMYIPPPAVDDLLAFIAASSGPGSALVADYFETDVVNGTCARKEAQALKSFVEDGGAPLAFGIARGQAEAFFESRGFQVVTRLNALACKEKYFRGVNAARPVSPIFNFVFARLAP